MSTQPISELEVRAAAERERLLHTMTAIRSRVRETLDVKRVAREYVKPVSAAGAILGLVVGYAFGGMFTRH
jgi:hypothetical protein